MRLTAARLLPTAIAATLLVFPATACAGNPAAPAAAGPSSSAPADDLPVPRDIDASGARKITAAPNPDWAVATAEGVWVAGVGKGLTRYDASSGAVSGEVQIYSVCSSMDQGLGSVWAMSCDFTAPTVVRIDQKTGAVVARIAIPARLPAESSLGVSGDAVWLLTGDVPAQLLMIDPQTNTVARTLPAPEGAVAVRAGFGSVWVSVAAPGQVVRIDPASGAVVATVTVGRGASFLAIGPDAVWVVSSSDGTVSRVDPTKNAAGSAIKVSSAVIHGGDIVAAADSVWVRLSEDALAVRIDPATNAVVDRLGPAAGSGGVALAEDSVWLSAGKAQSVWRLPR